MAHNTSNRCSHCNCVIVCNRNDDAKNKEQLSFIDDTNNECNPEDENVHVSEKTTKCEHTGKNGFVSGKHNAVVEISGNAKFLDSANSETDTNSNSVETGRLAVLETFPFNYYGNLKCLKLSGIQINSLPDNLSVLKNLYSLDLSNNYLTDLPKSLGDLHKLRLLNLSNNKLAELPPCLVSGLQILKYLNVSNNVIKTLDNPPLCLPFLQTLMLSNIMLIKLPVWFWNKNCHFLTHLDLSGNTCFDSEKHITWIKSLHYMYPSITKSVKSLDVSNCGIYLTNIEFLSEFKNVTCLKIGNRKGIFRNAIMELPMSVFADPSKIVELHINDVGLSVLPSKINLFTCLKVLNASRNHLSWLPDNFTELRSLGVLNLESNKLVLLTDGFNKLTNLKEVYLSENQLSNIKKDIEELTNLEVLDLYNNLVEDIPISKKHLIKLTSFDIEFNKVNTSSIEETGLMTASDYIKLRQRLRENLTDNRYDGICIDSSSTSSTATEEDEDLEYSYVKHENKNEDEYEDKCHGYSDIDSNDNDCQSDTNNKDKTAEEDWNEEEEEYWDVHDSDEEWDPSAHDQQKEAVKESYVMWSHNVFNSQPSCFPNYTYCPAADHMPKHHAVLRNPSPPKEDQFED